MENPMLRPMNEIPLTADDAAVLIASWKFVSNEHATRLVAEWQASPGDKFATGTHTLRYGASGWLLVSHDATAAYAVYRAAATQANAAVL